LYIIEPNLLITLLVNANSSNLSIFFPAKDFNDDFFDGIYSSPVFGLYWIYGLNKLRF